jgi:hypothetical protein
VEGASVEDRKVGGKLQERTRKCGCKLSKLTNRKKKKKVIWL